MPDIDVHLRIVGLFFSKTVQINNDRPISIKDVIDKYIKDNDFFYPVNDPVEANRGKAKPNGLAYTASSEGPGLQPHSILSFTHNYDGFYREKGKDDGCGRTIGGKKRLEGTYRLQELALDPIVVAWQSYLIDGTTHKNKTKTPPGLAIGSGTSQFTTFDIPLIGDQAIKGGDTIIWRMVAIARRPNVVFDTTACPNPPNPPAATMSE